MTLKEQMESIITELHRSGIKYGEAMLEFRRAYLVYILGRCKCNQSRAARALGMHRNTLSRQLEAHDIDLKELKELRIQRGQKRPAQRAFPYRYQELDATPLQKEKEA